MKFCQDHWDKLKAEIVLLGMEQLIASSGEELMDRIRVQAEGAEGGEKRGFDPLMDAHTNIISNALTVGGMDLMIALQTPPNPECPLCFLQQHHEQGCKIKGCGFTYDAWIGHAAKDALSHAKELGLVGES